MLAKSEMPSPPPGVPPQIWLQAMGGQAFDLIEPKPEAINFHTIATVLGRVPRFNAHTEGGVYSVAQHCTEGAKAILREGRPLLAAAAFLLHDAHEAYMTDISTPVANALAYHGGWPVRMAIRSLKSDLDAAIYAAAELPWPLPPQINELVREYDVRMLVTERNARLAPSPYPWGEPYDSAKPIDGADLGPLPASFASTSWQDMLRDLCPWIGLAL